MSTRSRIVCIVPKQFKPSTRNILSFHTFLSRESSKSETRSTEGGSSATQQATQQNKRPANMPSKGQGLEDTRCLQDKIDRIHKETPTGQHRNDRSHRSSSDIPPLKKRTNREFTAWAEYMGEEKDVEFIEWKKRMVGEAPMHPQDNSAHAEREQTENKKK
ncbi:hypothetical protein HRR83_002515 [Exophiala dermatitidis]|uniref:Uncharacterized protein n=1 Tax=Exophiala dermatitidis TaxID=5970 RepID=A0AAN6EXB9_EXODE|nr:hypothetical protein HRR74_002592 [Exophiala dermatitidis]KAJ4525335.1 hypothetical protein HRR73_002064 [Exophiala dermatitidis]KAJ4536647.1 hypothetical protein HRR76_004676 [Exophiala dermatitidis]KAJ4555752.1 hypothetical protein HRR77_001678 [Exophiala dermatitidis]KAJ4569052.1 hypothetical protein HRR81_006710 [Exophiala dermatitidis]